MWSHWLRHHDMPCAAMSQGRQVTREGRFTVCTVQTRVAESHVPSCALQAEAHEGLQLLLVPLVCLTTALVLTLPSTDALVVRAAPAE